MRRRISALELKQWELLESIEPWGERRADIRAARLCETIIRSNGGKATFKELLAMFEFERHQQTEAEADEILEAAAHRRGR